VNIRAGCLANRDRCMAGEAHAAGVSQKDFTTTWPGGQWKQCKSVWFVGNCFPVMQRTPLGAAPARPVGLLGCQSLIPCKSSEHRRKTWND